MNANGDRPTPGEMMDSGEREAMIEDGYDPDGAPPPPDLWLLPPDNDGERMWAQTRVTPWDVRYVLEAALATEAVKREQAEGRIVQLEAALATERAARERAEAQVAALMRVTEDQIRDAIKAQDSENANLPAASGAKGGE
jgi:hypothetical protein